VGQLLAAGGDGTPGGPAHDMAVNDCLAREHGSSQAADIASLTGKVGQSVALSLQVVPLIGANPEPSSVRLCTYETQSDPEGGCTRGDGRDNSQGPAGQRIVSKGTLCRLPFGLGSIGSAAGCKCMVGWVQHAPLIRCARVVRDKLIRTMHSGWKWV
jgi:hypothetical protein